MGLTVQDLSTLVHREGDRDYYIYLLDYGWKEPLADAMYANFEKMASESEMTRSVVIRGLESRHFANDVFSSHNINGENGIKYLPAILITTLTPSYFRNTTETNMMDDLLLLIPLKNVCNSTADVVELIKGIFEDIRAGVGLSNFSIARKLSKSDLGRFFDALILEPNISGLGIDLKRIFKTRGN